MENIEYANAYSEVLEILKHISKEDYNKIPKQRIELFETNANKDYIFTYNPSKTLNEQNVSKTAKTIIAILFRDYWATETQKEKIIAKEKYDRYVLEEQKKEQYIPNDIFKKNDKKYEIKNNINSKLPIEIKEKSIYRKIINLLKEIFHNVFS